MAGLAEDKKPSDNLSSTAAAYRRAAPVLDAVWQMIASVLLGTLAGWWLDGKFASRPWLLIAGAMLGVGAGMFLFLRAALTASKKTPVRGGGKQS